jgi:BMFP domain-containing protein YqiC
MAAIQPMVVEACRGKQISLHTPEYSGNAIIAPYSHFIVLRLKGGPIAICWQTGNRKRNTSDLSTMTQTTGRIFDELARLMTDAAGAAQGVRSEVETLMRGQAERILRELDIPQREEFEAVRAMAQKAREENALLEKRIAELEAELDEMVELAGAPATPRPVKRNKPKKRF